MKSPSVADPKEATSKTPMTQKADDFMRKVSSKSRQLDTPRVQQDVEVLFQQN